MMNKILARWLRKFMLAVMAIPGVVFAGNSTHQAPTSNQDSFDREFSKFDKDFDRLNQWQAETPASKKLKRAPSSNKAPSVPEKTGVDSANLGADNATGAASGGTITPLGDDAPSTAPQSKRSAKSSVVSSGLPKGAKVEKLAKNDRLGDQISDPEMRKKVQDLYKRSDVVVQQYVLPTN